MTALPFRRTSDLRGQPRCRNLIDCAGAQLHVHAQSLATVLQLDGEIDASNADLLAEAIRRYSRLKAPLILDLSQLDFIGMAGFRTLLALNCEHQRAQLHWSVVSGARLDRLADGLADHGLPLVDSVADSLQLVEDRLRARRRYLSGAARQHEPQRKAPDGLCRFGQGGHLRYVAAL
jgi:anti-anti-sigma factor